ncbi:MAG: TIGR01548 family HAD-type hydrolase [Cyanobacteria bacterium SID2]|nr:TIGR01548 family HAD-type hydrolase [Cyanobacteria bacterium SID2]MBP0005275.1 TIGR01548 family HAD-type hydrolase [Cyanobacteria bacterium SBC]
MNDSASHRLRDRVYTDANTPLAIAVFDIDGVIRDVGGSYRRALADTVEQFTEGAYRPTSEDIDRLKSEGVWNNDWEGSQELVLRHFESQGRDRSSIEIDFETLVAFFQSRYRGEDPDNPDNWTGYICHEPLLADTNYFESLTNAQILWGFFSGATRGSASYILQKRIGLRDPVLIAMEDAPGKPDPTGLFATVEQLERRANVSQPIPTLYVGDTVADLYAVQKAAQAASDRPWIGVGVLPPHVQTTPERQQKYTKLLTDAGATVVLSGVRELTPERVKSLVEQV